MPGAKGRTWQQWSPKEASEFEDLNSRDSLKPHEARRLKRYQEEYHRGEIED